MLQPRAQNMRKKQKRKEQNLIYTYIGSLAAVAIFDKKS